MKQVLADPASVARAAAEAFVGAAIEAVESTGRFMVALSGGNTPRALYERLAADGYTERIPWGATHVFWGDERCVPPFDPDSDYLLAKETMLEQVPIPEGRVHRIRGEEDPEVASLEYERLLRRSFGVLRGPASTAPGACFDLVLLGMGEDGHTASLFPGTPAVHETERWVVPVQAPVHPVRRVSLTPPVLNTAARKIFMVTGVGKAPVLVQVLEGPHDPARLPSQMIEGAEWIVDAEAASMLSG